MGRFGFEFPAGEGANSLPANRVALAERWLDPSLAACALLVGFGASWSWIVVAIAGILTIAAGALRPNALGKPYLLFGLALGLNSLLAWPHLGGLFASHAWAMVRPAIAVVLAGAIRDGVRAWGFGILFVSGAVLRSVVGLAGGVELDAFLFLPAAALILVVAAWAVGMLQGMWLAAAAGASLPLGAAIWGGSGPGAWLALLAAVGTMAILGRCVRRLAIPMALLAAIAFASHLFAKAPIASVSVELGSVWGQALDLLALNPAGIGAGNFATRSQEAFAALGLASWSHPHNSLLAVWAENGPVGLIAAVWILCALFAALRRSWKRLEEEGGRSGAGAQARNATRALVMGTAGVAGLFLAWSFTDDPLAESEIGHGIGFLLALGLASAGAAGLPSQEESLLSVGERSSRATPLPRKAAGGAAIAIAGAALGSTTALATTSIPIRLSCAALLLALAILHLPILRMPVAAALRGLVVFVGAALLAVRPFAAPLAPGSAQWWQSPSAAVALCALGAAVAGAGHAIRRPGRIRPAPVAGALSFLGVAAFVTLLDYGLLASIAPGFHPESPYNFAVAACAVSLLFIAWSGPLAFGEAEVDPRVRRLVHLPAAAVAVGLAATALAGV